MEVAEKTELRDPDEKVIEIELERLRTFTNHPFNLDSRKHDEDTTSLIAAIP